MSDQATIAAESKGSDQETGRYRPSRTWLACVAVLVLLLLGFVGLGTYSWFRQHDAEQVAQREQAILDATRTELNLMANLQHTTARDAIAKLRAGATGAFRQQFAGADSAFFTLLDQGKVESSGRVTEAAIQRSDGKSADVLAAVTTTVKNTDTPSGEPRNYRSLVSLRYEGGRWLTADARVVP